MQNHSRVDLLLFSYLSIIFIACRIMHIPELVKAIISAPTIFIVPILFGKSILVFIKSYVNFFHSLTRSYTLCYLFGVLVMILIGYPLQFLGVPVTALYFVILVTILGYFLRLLMIRVFLLKYSHCHVTSISLDQIMGKKWFLAILSTLFSSVLTTILAHLNYPPGIVSLDQMMGIEFVQPLERLMDYGFLDFYKTRCIPILLAGLAKVLGNVDVYYLYWSLPFVLTSVLSLGTLKLVYDLTKNLKIAMASGTLVSVLNMGLDYGGFFDTIHFLYRYQTIIDAIFPWMVSNLYSEISKVLRTKEEKDVLKYATLISLTFLVIDALFISADVAGVFSSFPREQLSPGLIFLFMLFILVLSSHKRDNKSFSAIIVMVLSLLFLIVMDPKQPFIFHGTCLFLFTMLLILSFNKKLRSLIFYGSVLMFIFIILVVFNVVSLCRVFSEYDRITGITNSWTANFKLNSLIKMNSKPVVYFYLAGIPILLAVSYLQEDSNQLTMTILSIITLLTYFAPVNLTNPLAQHLMNIQMAFVIASFLDKITSLIYRKAGISIKFFQKYCLYLSKRHLRIQAFTIFATIILLIFIITAQQAYVVRYSWKPNFSPYRSILSEYELSAIHFIRKNVTTDCRIISDPLTMRFFTSFTGSSRIWLTEPEMIPGRSAPDDIETLHIVKREILSGYSSGQICKAIKEISTKIPHSERPFLEFTGLRAPNRFIIVISGRTAWWIDKVQGIDLHPLSGVTYKVSERHIRIFLNNPSLFKLIYKHEPYIYIFVANCNGLT